MRLRVRASNPARPGIATATLAAAWVLSVSFGARSAIAAAAPEYEKRFRDELNCRIATNRYQPPNLAVSLDPSGPPPALPLVVRGDQGRLAQNWVFEENGSYLVRVPADDCGELRKLLELPGRRLLQLYAGKLAGECPRHGRDLAGDPAVCRAGLQLRIDRIRRAIDPAARCNADDFKQVLVSLRDLPDGRRYLHGFEARSPYALQHLRGEARRSFDRPWLQPGAVAQRDLPPNPFVDDASYDAQLRSSNAFRGGRYPAALKTYRTVLEQCASTFPEVMPAKIARIDEIFGPPPRKIDPASVRSVQAPEHSSGLAR